MSALMKAVFCLAGLNYILALGTLTSIEHYPSLIQLEHYSGRFWLQRCVGSILTNFHVLSAESCLRIALNNYRVRAGASIRGVDGVVGSVRHILKHPSSNFLGDVGDIGIIVLRFQLFFGPTIAQASIMPDGFILPENMPVELVGWGSTTFQEVGGIVINDDLYSLELRTKNFDACVEAYRAYPGNRPGNVTAHMMCTGLSTSAGRDFDFIETGAPLYFANIVAGVVSFGVARASDEMPIVATEISYYTSWIVENAV